MSEETHQAPSDHSPKEGLSRGGEGDRPLRDVVRHTLVYGFGNVSVAFLSLALVPIYTHRLSPADYGLLALVLALYGFLGRLYDLGLTNSVGRYFFEYRKGGMDGAESGPGIAEMANTTMAYLLAHAGILSLVLWAAAGPVSELMSGGSENADLIRIVSVTLFADALAIVPLTLIRMEERSGYFVVVTTVRFATALALNVLFVVVFEWGVRGILLSGAITSGALLLVLSPEFVRNRGGRISKAILGEMLRFGLPFLPVPLSIWLIDYSDRYLLELLRSREEVGFYALGYKIAQVMQLAVVAFSMGWAPLRYRIYERPDAKAIYGRIATLYLVGAALLSVALILVSREVISVVAPASYAPAAIVVAPLVASYATYGLYLIFTTGMGVTMWTLPMAWIGIAGAVANVALNLVLIPELGMMGAAVTTVLANVILAGGAWYFSDRVYPIPYEWGAAAKILGLAVAVTAAGTFAEPAGLVAGLGAAMLFVGSFIVLLFVTGVLTGSDVVAANRWARDLIGAPRR